MVDMVSRLEGIKHFELLMFGNFHIALGYIQF